MRHRRSTGRALIACASAFMLTGCGDPDPVDETLELARFLPAGASNFHSVDVDALREELGLAPDAYTPEIKAFVRDALIEPLNGRAVDQIVSTGGEGGVMAIRTDQTEEQVAAALDESETSSHGASVAGAGAGVLVITTREALAPELVAEPLGGPSEAVVLYPYLHGSSKRIYVAPPAGDPCVISFGVSQTGRGSEATFAIRVADSPAEPERLDSALLAIDDLRFAEPEVDERTITIDFEPAAGGSPAPAMDFLLEKLPGPGSYDCAD